MTGDPPAGLHVRLDADVVVRAAGRVLVGGAPARLLRLTDAGSAHVARWRAGDVVGEGPAVGALARRLLDAGVLVPDPTPAPTAGLAVVVAAHGRPTPLARCLRAIQRTAPGASIVVVDDGSPDPALVRALALAHGATIVRNEVNRGPAAARNRGLAATDAPLVAFVDSDAVVERGCLARLAGHFVDPAVGAVAPRVLPTAPGATAVAAYEARRSALDMGVHAGRVAPGARVPYVPAVTLVARRAAAGAGFDETLRTGEDVDLVWRMAGAGWTVRYDPSVAVRHEHLATARDLASRRFAYAASIGPLARRHPGALPALRLDAATGVVALALLRRPVLASALAGWGLVRLRATLDDRAPQPTALALELGGRSLVRATRDVARATRRPWWPLVALAALRRPHAGALLAGAWAVGLAERRAEEPADAALAIADDLIAGAGTWWACARHRTLAPLLPARR